MKVKHYSLSYKRQAQPNKKYKDLKQKQKARIADWMYMETASFYLENQRMPDGREQEKIVQEIFYKLERFAIWVPHGEVLQQYKKRQAFYEVRIKRDIDKNANGTLVAQGKLGLEKSEKKQPRSREKLKKLKHRNSDLTMEDYQDDRFFYIAGYTAGGAPYGVIWEEMGLEPYEDLEMEEE